MTRVCYGDRPWNGCERGRLAWLADGWLEAAYDALMEFGIDGVNILPLGKG